MTPIRKCPYFGCELKVELSQQALVEDHANDCAFHVPNHTHQDRSVTLCNRLSVARAGHLEHKHYSFNEWPDFWILGRFGGLSGSMTVAIKMFAGFSAMTVSCSRAIGQMLVWLRD